MQKGHQTSNWPCGTYAAHMWQTYIYVAAWLTRKHSSKMCTTHLPTIHVSAAATNCGQNSWHTLLKILPCPNFIAGSKYTAWPYMIHGDLLAFKPMWNVLHGPMCCMTQCDAWQMWYIVTFLHINSFLVWSIWCKVIFLHLSLFYT